jgi:hypothetical protein
MGKWSAFIFMGRLSEVDRPQQIPTSFDRLDLRLGLGRSGVPSMSPAASSENTKSFPSPNEKAGRSKPTDKKAVFLHHCATILHECLCKSSGLFFEVRAASLTS